MPNNQTNARITLWLLTAAGAVLVFIMLRPYAESMIVGALLAVVFHPPHTRIQRWIRNENASAVISTVLVLLLFVGPLSVILPLLAGELRESVAALRAPPDAILEQIANWMNLPVDDLKRALAARLQEAGEAMLRQGVAVIGIATGGIIQTIVAIGAFFFMIRDGITLLEETLLISPLGRERTESLLHVAGEMIQASVYGVLAVAAAQGTLCGIGMWIAGFPAPVLWGLATAAVSVLPLVGSGLVWLPAAIVLFAKGSIGKGIFMLAWGGGVVAMSDNVVRPWILAARMPINPLLVMVSMLGSAQAFGVIGFVAGPVVLAIFFALLRTLREEVAPVRLE